MNSNILKAAAAGVGVVGLLAGGGTYALYHDYNNVGTNTVGAGTMELTVSPSGSADYTFNNLKLTPGDLGHNYEYQFLVSSNKADSVPNGNLTMNFANLVGTEDGCHGDEADAIADGGDGGTCASAPGSAAAPAYKGQFPSNAQVTINVTAPTNDLTHACSLAHGSAHPVAPLSSFFDASGNGIPVTLANNVQPGYGVCVAMAIGFPDSVGNAVQGDSATFDSVFKLDQVDTTP